jgi:hypothetical protein
MVNETSSEKSTPLLGGLASILGLLGITLFFSGWIYRWAYFSYFNLDVNIQTYTAQSFLIVPIQIYFGNVSNIVKTSLVLVALPLLIALSQLALNGLQIAGNKVLQRMAWYRALQARPSVPAVGVQVRSHFTASLRDELVIVAWVLFAIFWLCQHQGLADARRDAVDRTSTLPVVSLLLPQRDGVLAKDLRLLEDNGAPITDLPLGTHALIGDLDLARKLRLTSLSDRKHKRLWRLLAQEPTGWLYLIRTLPSTADANERPIVLAIPNAKPGQTMILSPESPEMSS